MTYTIDPTQPFPKRWLDANGEPILVMGEPVEGYLLARRPGCAPFAISVKDILNSGRHPHRFGPFTLARKGRR
ncbi:hypothetical protein [Pararhizobium haloflavum]|uniref:hypothetical protein n=1 Tax=Pararhizobium haloflavum TaxID=2037914 RepID=UPI000C195889|nr:hypothetical protein [Pararhizobium haloflavum]